jgi:hypothetical protein
VPVLHLHAGGLQQQARGSQFRRHRRGADAADRAAYLRQRVTCDALDVCHFAARRARIAFDQPPGEFRFQRHHR